MAPPIHAGPLVSSVIFLKCSKNITHAESRPCVGRSPRERALFKERFGCTKTELRQKLETMFRDGMSWDNYGKLWEIDHIKPGAAFDLTDPDQQKYSRYSPRTNSAYTLSHTSLTLPRVRSVSRFNKRVNSMDSVFILSRMVISKACPWLHLARSLI